MAKSNISEDMENMLNELFPSPQDKKNKKKSEAIERSHSEECDIEGGFLDPIVENSAPDNKNNGLITKIWGGAGWLFGHSVTFGYPLEPTEEQKQFFKQYFILLGKVLPCKYCRESYAKFISEGDTELTDAVMTNRHTLTKWFYDIHEAVNKKLGMDYGVTYDDVVLKYESFRAQCGHTVNTKVPVQGCVAPLDYKAFSYKKLYQIDCPVFSLELSGPFVRLAKIRGVDSSLFNFYDLISHSQCDFSAIKKTVDWTNRNYYCRKQIIYMRESAIPSIEQTGRWKDTPTIDELKLLLHLSSNLNKRELSGCIRKLMSNQKYLSKITSIY
jgi:hypothetical protein